MAACYWSNAMYLMPNRSEVPRNNISEHVPSTLYPALLITKM